MERILNLRGFALSLAAFAIVAFASATTVKADTVNVVGNTHGSLATATVSCTFNAQTNTLTFTITNTSPFDARITGIGFDLPPVGNANASGLNGFTGNVVFQPAGVNFFFSDAAAGNVPQFNSVVLDFGFYTQQNAGNPNFGGGSPNDGLPPGIPPNNQASFTVTGAAFAGFTEAQICNAIYVRFQRVGEPPGELSDVAVPNGQVPEPATMLLLGTGLVGVAAGLRRRRKK